MSTVESIIAQSRSFARRFRNAQRGLPQSCPDLPDNVKVYRAATDSYAALFVIVTLGQEPNAMTLVNIYGAFDAAKIGGSINLQMMASETPDASTGSKNPFMMQMIAYRGDSEGAAFFAKPDGPPPCPTFNYSIVTTNISADGAFSIKPATWKQGDADAYTFNVSDLTPFTMQELGSVDLWCKVPSAAPPALSSEPAKTDVKKKAVQLKSVLFFVAAVVIVLIVVMLVLANKGK